MKLSRSRFDPVAHLRLYLFAVFSASMRLATLLTNRKLITPEEFLGPLGYVSEAMDGERRPTSCWLHPYMADSGIRVKE
ncbi:MAG: hypothetical protein SVW57_11145 [Thermodesulfobacteriota bacterium]|nr:hypothetical protein [Thermodesulfobacteriota bacterium]